MTAKQFFTVDDICAPINLFTLFHN